MHCRLLYRLWNWSMDPDTGIISWKLCVSWEKIKLHTQVKSFTIKTVHSRFCQAEHAAALLHSVNTVNPESNSYMRAHSLKYLTLFKGEELRTAQKVAIYTIESKGLIYSAWSEVHGASAFRACPAPLLLVKRHIIWTQSKAQRGLYLILINHRCVLGVTSTKPISVISISL